MTRSTVVKELHKQAWTRTWTNVIGPHIALDKSCHDYKHEHLGKEKLRSNDNIIVPNLINSTTKDFQYWFFTLLFLLENKSNRITKRI